MTRINRRSFIKNSTLALGAMAL
ncbi:twin-arginine translocation signal domain-containing protein, partial [Winogradskyella sp.]